MLNLDTEINIDLPGFFRWWGRELYELMPSKIRRLFDEIHSLIIVEAEGDNLRISYATREKTIELGVFELNDLGQSQYRDLINDKPAYNSAEILIRLPRSYVVNKQIYVPEAAAKNLEQVIGFELDRYTPFKSEQVYFDFVVAGKDKINKQLRLLLYVAPKEKLNTLLDQVVEWGLELSYVDCEQSPSTLNKKNERYNLLPAAYRRKKNQLPIIMIISAMVLFLLMTGGVVALPLWMESQVVDELTKETRRVEKQAIKVDDLKKKVDVLYEQTNELINKKKEKPSLVDILDELGKLMKDDTWLTKLKFTERKLEIHGRSPTASILIGSFEKTKLFNNTRFISPVNQDKKTGLEWFQISTEIAPAGSDD